MKLSKSMVVDALSKLKNGKTPEQWFMSYGLQFTQRDVDELYVDLKTMFGYDKDAKQDDQSMPSMLTMAANLAHTARDVITNAAAGKSTTVSAEVKAARLSECMQCPAYNKAKGRCTKCGCHMKAKADLTAAKCPLKKWAE